MPRLQKCPCGSGQYPEAQHDGYGIFLCYTCSKCERAKMRGYRRDIRERYDCDEPIEPHDDTPSIDWGGWDKPSEY